MSKAAEILFLSQPTVTNRIQALENETKEQLFIRANRKMILTDAGRAFLPFALKILDNVNDGLHNVQQLRKQVRGKLTIGMFYSAVPKFNPHIISFAKRYPELRLSIKTRHSEEVGELVLNHFVDVGIVRTVKSSALNIKTIMQDELILAIYPEHHLATSNKITPEALRNEKIIFLYTGSLDREIIHKCFCGYNFQSNVVIETESAELAKQHVIEKIGISFLPRFNIQSEIEQGSIIAKELSDIPKELKRNIDLIWLKTNYSNHLTELFVQFIINKINQSSYPN